MKQTTQPSPRQVEVELTELRDKIAALLAKRRSTQEKELLTTASSALERKDIKNLQTSLEKLYRFRQRNGNTPKFLAEALILKAHAAFAAGAVPKALSFALKAVELVPSNASHHYNCTYFMVQLDHYEEAKKHAHIVLELTKRQKKPTVIRIRTLRQLGWIAREHDNNYKESADYYKEYLDLKTQCGLVPNYRDYNDVGYAYEKTEMYPEAELYYKKTLRAFKENTSSDDLKEISIYYAALRRMWAHTKATHKALSFINKERAILAKQNRPSDDPYLKIVEEHYQETLKLIARNEREKGNTEKALVLYENLLSREEAKNCPEDKMLFFLRAQIQYLRKRKFLQALARMDKKTPKSRNIGLSRWTYLLDRDRPPLLPIS